ncbi:sensor histidine kinase [Clostridiisalibacter paucivorans]|uniref:sensor histidine kinase n=1 Tax=Clostridiisalibacter paucivorans TaxID=408753 RepID=UPI00047C0770|nr:ATP-binding protein [Clostridiisalibacter paucivorans]
MNIYIFFNDVAVNSIEAIIIMVFFLAVLGKKNFLASNIYRTTLFIITYTIFAYWASKYMPVGYHTILITIFMIISLGVFTSSKIVPTFIAVMAIMIYIMAIDTLMVFMFSAIGKYTANDIFNNPIVRFKISILSKIVQLSLAMLFYRLRQSRLKRIEIDSENTITSYLFFGVFLMGVFVLSFNYAVSSRENIVLYEVLLSILFFLFILFGYLIYREQEKLLKIKYKSEMQDEYINNLETVVNIIRREKHDFSNHINTIHAICVLNKPNALDRIKKYLDSLSVNLKKSYHFYNTGNDYIDGLLAVKSNYAFENDIVLDVDFEQPLSMVPMDDYNIVSILSNIIDNAFDAIISQDMDNGVISFSTYIEDGRYHISIANNGPEISPDHIKKIFDNGFSTKTEDKSDHGLGLFITKSLVEKNDGKIEVFSDENETQFLITFEENMLRNDEDGSTGKEVHPLNI